MWLSLTLLTSDFYWLWYFFFFKQKTAYEMRISDWSSDVCSSDLMGTPVGRNPLISLISGRRAGRLWVPLGRRPGRGSRTRTYDPRFWRQIGRASCRERVCQYV